VTNTFATPSTAISIIVGSCFTRVYTCTFSGCALTGRERATVVKSTFASYAASRPVHFTSSTAGTFTASFDSDGMSNVSISSHSGVIYARNRLTANAECRARVRGTVPERLDLAGAPWVSCQSCGKRHRVGTEGVGPGAAPFVDVFLLASFCHLGRHMRLRTPNTTRHAMKAYEHSGAHERGTHGDAWEPSCPSRRIPSNPQLARRQGPLWVHLSASLCTCTYTSKPIKSCPNSQTEHNGNRREFEPTTHSAWTVAQGS
jgi:hypothetical protein